MPRNFDHRVELMFPIKNHHLKKRICRDIVAPVLTDNCRVYELGSDGFYWRRTPLNGESKRDAQQILVDYYRPEGGIAIARPR